MGVSRIIAEIRKVRELTNFIMVSIAFMVKKIIQNKIMLFSVSSGVFG
jgi:hypothetical protein